MAGRLDPATWRRLEPLLDAALELEGDRREAYVTAECAGDTTLRAELERLLKSCQAGESLLERPAADLWPELVVEPGRVVAPGTRIGPYRVLSEAGRGGMATVYLAERADGVYRKRVALKLVSSALGQDENLARRFQDERQILASLDHPRIARLLDGGVTPDGTPWFALEYVEGTPIERAAEERGLTVDDRLRLFLRVCEAVQYAHRNLVVHRDLKPSNILITPDGQVKLLDFGIAKMLGPDARPEAEARTMVGRAWMTPEYAAPEQIRGEPVTTATDVYQLGIVLYELLAGRRPFERDGGSLFDLEQAVLLREPAKPSVTVVRTRQGSSSAGTQDAVVLDRTPAVPSPRLHRILRGDLDAIVLKALRKEPLKRYASAGELAADVENYLQGRPVAARRGTTLYRAGKFMRRHRWGVGMAAALALLLVGYAVTVTVQTARVRTEAAKAQQVTDFLMSVLLEGDADRATGENVTARELLDRGVERADDLSDQPEVQAQMLTLVGDAYQNWGLYDRAQPLLERALELRREVLGEEHEDVAETLNELGTLLHNRGNYAAAESLLGRALAMRRKVLGEEHGEVARTMVDLARVLEKRGHYERAERLQHQALAMRRRVQMTQELPPKPRRSLASGDEWRGDAHLWVAVSLSDVARLAWQRGDLDAAESTYRESLAILRRTLGEEHWYIANDMTSLGRVLTDQGEHATAESLLVASLAMKRKLLGDDHASIPKTLVALGTLSRKTGDFARADSLLREALRRGRAAFGSTHPSLTSALVGLAQTQLDQRDAAPAEPLLREALEIHQRATPDDRRTIAEIQSQLGRCLTMLGRYDEAEPVLVQSHRTLVSEYGEMDRRAQEARQYLVDLFTTQGKMEQASAYLPLVGRETGK